MHMQFSGSWLLVFLTGIDQSREFLPPSPMQYFGFFRELVVQKPQFGNWVRYQSLPQKLSEEKVFQQEINSENPQ